MKIITSLFTLLLVMSLFSCRGNKEQEVSSKETSNDVQIKEVEIQTTPVYETVIDTSDSAKPKPNESKGARADAYELARKTGSEMGYIDGRADGLKGNFRRHGAHYYNPYSDDWLKVCYMVSYEDAYEVGFYEVNPDYDDQDDYYYNDDYDEYYDY